MKFALKLFVIILFAIINLNAQNGSTVRIYGKVIDQSGKPVEGAEVMILNSQFDPVRKVMSKAGGDYYLDVEKGTYLALTATKDYKTKYLEYWFWNLAVDGKMNINPVLGGLEVYSLAAYQPKGMPTSLFIYFRPMSLERFLGGKQYKAENTKGDFDIAPELKKDDVKITLNGKTTEILEINRVREISGSNQFMTAYLVQIFLSPKIENPEKILVNVSLTDTKTKEKGEGAVIFGK
jgi:hypothetical protein